MQYAFTFSEIDVKVPRSRSADTDYATLGIAVVDAQGTQVAMHGPITKTLGDLGGGSTAAVNLGFQDMDVPDGGSLAVAAMVINKGSWDGTMPLEEALNIVGGAVVGAVVSGSLVGVAATGGAATPIAVWQAALITAGVVGVLEGVKLLFADCDGWVAGSGFTLGRTALDQETQNGIFSWPVEYPGTDSPAGCGANSDYVAHYWVGKQEQILTVPRVTGMSPADARRVVEQAGLFFQIGSAEAARVEAPEVMMQSPVPGTAVPRGSAVTVVVADPEAGHGGGGGGHQRP